MGSEGSYDVFLTPPNALWSACSDTVLGLPVGNGTVATADFVKCLLALRRVEMTREHIAFAVAIAVPQVNGGLMVNHPRDIERNPVELIHMRGG